MKQLCCFFFQTSTIRHGSRGLKALRKVSVSSVQTTVLKRKKIPGCRYGKKSTTCTQSLKIKTPYKNTRLKSKTWVITICSFIKEFLWAKQHSVNDTAHNEKNPLLHLHPCFGETIPCEKNLHWRNFSTLEKKKEKDSSYSKNSQDGLSKALKNVVERFLIKWTKSAHMTVTYGQGKVTSQNDWKLLLQHSSVCIYAQLACINKIYAQLFRAKVP